MNLMTIHNQRAVISHDPDIDMFRGEFVGLAGGADVYARTIDELHAEGATSLKLYLDMCREQDREPYRHVSGKFNARIHRELHARAMEVATAKGISLNQLVEEAIQHEVA